MTDNISIKEVLAVVLLFVYWVYAYQYMDMVTNTESMIEWAINVSANIIVILVNIIPIFFVVGFGVFSYLVMRGKI